MLKRPSNKSRTEVQVLARRAVETYGGGAVCRVWFKYDCRGCGERCIAPEANVLPEDGTCEVCGTITPILGAGYSLEIRVSRFVDWNKQRTLLLRPQYQSDRGDA